MKKLIGLVGFIGSGKSTAASYLNENGYVQFSFGGHVKDVASAAFGWDRTLLEGITDESRAWRETVDPWWAYRLGIPELSPRWILQHWGTELVRNKFHNDFWVASLENKILTAGEDSNIVISDVRFPNEINALRKLGGEVHWVQQSLPEWFTTAYNELRYLEARGYETGWESEMNRKYPDVHASEYSWITQQFDSIINNLGSLEDLYRHLDKIK